MSSLESLKMEMSGLLMAYEIIVTNVTIGLSNGVSCSGTRTKINTFSPHQKKKKFFRS